MSRPVLAHTGQGRFSYIRLASCPNLRDGGKEIETQPTIVKINNAP